MSTMTLLVFGKVQERVGLVHSNPSTDLGSIHNKVKVVCTSVGRVRFFLKDSFAWAVLYISVGSTAEHMEY